MLPEKFQNAAIGDSLLFVFPLSPYFIATIFLSLTFCGTVLVTYILKAVKVTTIGSKLFAVIYRTVPFTFGGLLLAIAVWALLVY